MKTSQLLKRSLSYYWRTNIAVVLGVAVAIAVLAGALLVGDSVRASLRNLVVSRLGETSFVVTSSGFLREQLTTDIQSDPQFAANNLSGVCPMIQLQGTVTHESSKRVGSAIKVYGVDERFWTFSHVVGKAPQNRSVFLSQSLASELATKPGDSIILRIEKPTDIPLESLHSKKDELGETLRLTVGDTLDAKNLGDFSIQPQQSGVRAIFISLKVLQQELEQPDKVNLILVSEVKGQTQTDKTAALDKILRERAIAADLGIAVRHLTADEVRDLTVVPRPIISLEHDSKIISDPLATIVRDTASGRGQLMEFFSYLANSIGAKDKSVPYSLITAIGDDTFQQIRQHSAESALKTDRPPIILNEWAATDLGVRSGDEVTIEYYLWQADVGRLDTKTATFQLAGVVPITGLAADRNLVPDYPGITGSENLSDWDPPFPINLERIRQKDENYWQQYRTTPKAFIPLSVGQTLWGSRFGKLTSMRFYANDESVSFESKLKEALNPTVMGVAVIPVRSQGLEASRGATDFGEYFLYFSFFLVVSALLLTTLFFKLGIEQRVREIGALRAMGFGPSTIRRLFIAEGILLSVIGSVIGLLGAIAYGQLMMFGLRTWWVDAVGTTSLDLHIAPMTLLIGAVAGIFASLLCVALTLRGLKKQSTRSLLAGTISGTAFKANAGKTSLGIGLLLTLLGLLLLVAAALHLIGQVAGFFGGGFLLLAAFLFLQSSWLKRRNKSLLTGAGWWPIARLGFRNATYRPARSILCISLIASATFIIVAVDSFRHREGAATFERSSGTGGFPLMAESLLPLVKDPNSQESKEELNLAGDDLRNVQLTRFRVQPGDDASCLNLYQPQNPKIIAPTDDFLQSDRFTFQSSLPGTNEEQTNPWLLLKRVFDDGAIPVIADANSLNYVLHLKLGDDLVLENGGQPIRVRVVAALSGSLFQSELVMSENNFIRAFPDQQGYRFFLIDLPASSQSTAVTSALEDRLTDFGFDVQSTSERLANFHRVENTYLSTFQMLGGLGLVLGTIGLAAVLLRNVLERRRELALMRAVGYNAQHFTLMIIAENAFLLFAGVLTGAVCAFLAITPVFISRQGQPFNLSLGLLLLAVLVSGLIASVAATWTTIRMPLLSSLRAE
jgi:putative ABC transport system permease protein